VGQALNLFVGDESIESPYLSRSFKDELIQPSYFSLKDFLSDDEIKIITPNSYGEITIGKKRKVTDSDTSKILEIFTKTLKGKSENRNSIDKIFDDIYITSEKIEDRERDPVFLKKTIYKIQQYLQINASQLPLVHSIFNSKDLNEEEEISIIINGVKAFAECDIYYYDNYKSIRNKIHLRSYWEDTGKIDFYVSVEPEIIINKQKFYTKTISKAQQFEDEFEKIYDFLNEAIKLNKKVLWEIG